MQCCALVMYIVLIVLTSMHVCVITMHNRLAREVEGDEEDDDQVYYILYNI